MIYAYIKIYKGNQVKIAMIIWSIVATMVTVDAMGCDYKMVVNSSKLEAVLKNITIPLKDAQIVCLDVPVVKPTNGFIEFNSTNLGNASCSDLKMIVIDPDKMKLEKSFGSQPGTIGKYKAGRWKMKLKLRSGCSKYNFGAKW